MGIGRQWVTREICGQLIAAYCKKQCARTPIWGFVDELEPLQKCESMVLASSNRLRARWLHYLEICAIAYQQMHRGEEVSEIMMSVEIRRQALAQAVVDAVQNYPKQPHRMTWAGEEADLARFAAEGHYDSDNGAD